jgi:putative transposase
MPRLARVDVGDIVYHVINRSNGRSTVFDSDAAYRAFETVLGEAGEKFDMRILAYVLMPNHWHLLLYPRTDGALAPFMAWLTNTHTRRYRVATGTVGNGHLYQGRYKSFPVDDDRHLLTVLKYIERNPVRAGLAQFPDAWRWGSASLRLGGAAGMLAEPPVPLPRGYRESIRSPEAAAELDILRRAVIKGIPYGREAWRDRTIGRFSLEQALRSPGRPRKRNGV